MAPPYDRRRRSGADGPEPYAGSPVDNIGGRFRALPHPRGMPPIDYPLDPRVLALAEKRRGVFSSAEAYELGHTAKDIQRLRAAKVLHSVRRGTYVLRETWEAADDLERHRISTAALALVLTGPATLSHVTAAVDHDLAMLEPDLTVLHVTRNGPSGTRVEAGLAHHGGALPDHHVERRESGLDVVTRARAALDVARSSTRMEAAVAVLDSALRDGVSRADLEEVLDVCRGWRGGRLAGGAVSWADGRAANPGESWSRVELIRQGVPPDDLQVALYDDDGLIGYGDFGWDGVIGEFDGRVKYAVDRAAGPDGAGDVLWAEKRREDRIRARGYEMVRWTYADLSRPGLLGVRVRRALDRAAGRRRVIA